MAKKMNKVQEEFLKKIQSPWLWFTIAGILFFGNFAYLLHMPRIPANWYWFILAIVVAENLLKRVIIPVGGLLWEIIQTMIAWIIWPLILVFWEIFQPVYKRWLKPYEEKFIKPVAIPVFIFLIFYEEIILWALRKIVFPGVKYFIRAAPAWMIVSIFLALEIGKILAKPFLFVAFGFGFLPGIAFLAGYIAVSFFSLQIMVHGSDKLRSYAWFNKLYEWAVETLGPYKKMAKDWWKSQSIYHWWKGVKNRAIKNKNTFFAQVTARAKSWRQKKTD